MAESQGVFMASSSEDAAAAAVGATAAGWYQIHFYSAAALLAMYSAVLATADLSACLSVSVMFRCFVHRNEDTIVWSSALHNDSFWAVEAKFIQSYAKDHPSEDVKIETPPCRWRKFDQ